MEVTILQFNEPAIWDRCLYEQLEVSPLPPESWGIVEHHIDNKKRQRIQRIDRTWQN
jgi:hypothetical protein